MPPLPSPLPRLVLYHQTHHDAAGRPISLLPLTSQPGIRVTHVIVAALHINRSPAGLTLNDHAPDDARFCSLWAELRLLQASGVKVLAMLGGAAQGTYSRLDFPNACAIVGHDDAQPAPGSSAQSTSSQPASFAPSGSSSQPNSSTTSGHPPPGHPTHHSSDPPPSFEAFYTPLRDLVRLHALDGIDLDVEEPMSLPGIMRLIDRLRADFGPDFLITMAPVATALVDVEKNLSGFDYEALEVLRGSHIAWYNTQFYCGWGDLHTGSTALYRLILHRGWPSSKIVIGLVTNPSNGSGFVPWPLLHLLLSSINRAHADSFGGVMGWEYFNSLPGDTDQPWQWAQHMTLLLRGKAPSPTLAHDDSIPAPLPHAFDYFSDTIDE